MLFAGLWAASPVQAQLQNVTGAVAAGVYVLDSEGTPKTVVPAGVEVDLRGYLGHPDFLHYSVQPWFNFGDPFGGVDIRPGNGLVVTSNFFRRRAFPFSLSYTTSKSSAIGLDPQGINFGFTRLGATSQTSLFSLSGSVRLPRLPTFSYTYGRDTRSSEPDGAGVESTARGENYQLGLSAVRFGWDWRLIYGGGKSVTELGGAASGVFFDLRHDYSRLDFGARGPVWRLGQMVFNVERTARNDTLAGQERDDAAQRALLNFTSQPVKPLSLTASLLVQSGRFRGAVFPAGLGSPESFRSESKIDSYSTTFQARYQVRSDWTLLGSVGQSRVQTEGLGLLASRGSGSVGALGVVYSHPYRWATLSASYSRAFSRTDSATNGRTGGQDTIQVVFQGGRIYGLNWDASARFSRQALDGLSESLQSALFQNNQEFSLTYSLSRVVARFLVRGSIAYQKNSVSLRDPLSTKNDSTNLAYGVEVRNDRIDFEYSRNLQDQTSVLPFNSGLDPFLTSLGSQSLRARVRLLARLEAEVLYRSSRTTLFPQLRTEFSNLVVAARYRFRQIQLEGGYNHSRATSFLLEGSERTGLYFRVLRRFQIL